MSQSRTKNSIKNGSYAIGFYLVSFILKFFSRKIFLDYLGADILGLNTTVTNLLQFLNIAELGISAGISYTLYKPLNDSNYDSINEIISLQGKLYKRVASLIIIGSIILMLFFPMIFKKITLPLWYAYASFGVVLFSALLGYFFNYKQIILSASQQGYKITLSYQGVLIIKTLLQMYAVYYFEYAYIWWLILEVIFTVIASISLHITTKKSFPALKSSSSSFRNLRNKYPQITTKIKQLFFHKIGGVVLTQSSPLVIYAYSTLKVVAYYGNYLVVISGIQQILSAIFNGINAGIGNLIADSNKEKQLDVFYELFSANFLVVVTACFWGYLLTPIFIKLWIGEQYIMSSSTLILMLLILFVNTFRTTVDSYIFAMGLFQDIWAPVAEAILNISLSILFGYYWGLNGVLTGVLSSLVIIVVLWRSIFLFKYGLRASYWFYIVTYIKHVLAFGCSVILFIFIHNLLPTNKLIWLQYINILIFPLIFIGCLMLFHTKIKVFINRIIYLFR